MSSDPRPAAPQGLASSARPALVLAGLLALLAFASPAALSLAQQPPPPTPIVVTATPVPQIIVVTATPSAPPVPKTFWGEYGKTIATHWWD